MPRTLQGFTVHAESSLRSGVAQPATGAFGALSHYRRLRREQWPVVLVTDPLGRVVDEAELHRQIAVG